MTATPDDQGHRLPDDDPNAALLHTALAMVEKASELNLIVRLLGGVAVAVHSPVAARRPSLQRRYFDIDMVTNATRMGALDAVFEDFGYEPSRKFNALHGSRRLLYTNEAEERQIDIFVSNFEMCHSLPLGRRLEVDAPTVPLAELFLTKAQIVELNEKDARDLIALLLEHEIAAGDDETLNSDRIGELCGTDWGLWRTVSSTLDHVGAVAEGLLDTTDTAKVGAQLDRMRRVLEDAPKTRRWKVRARIGERRSWYELPEDPRRNVAT